ncbi:MAG: MFS transporter [Streptomyces sp.]|uniref:MFS transporter n=1 Tax=Streptomyces sp. TaxID=1931 RepID=UPI0025F4707D|nr:MFS transporter [Streptomyces sp.]MBW8801557.1 MFS transporter [Streptomyces sp.]
MDSSSRISGRRLLALVVLCGAAMMTVLDETVVNVALPSIQRDLGFSADDLSWVVNAYLVAFGSLLLLAGGVGDLIGRRRVLLGGLALFTAASLACGLAPDAAGLVAARFAQGSGAALASSVALGMVVSLFEEEAVRSRAIGIYSFMMSAGGIVTDLAGWRWAFFLNVPIGIAMLAIGVRVLDVEPRRPTAARPDVPSAAMLVLGMAATILAVVDPHRRFVAVVAVAALAGFARRQTRTANPLVPVTVLRSRTVVTANVVLALLAGAMLGFQFLVTQYFQRSLQYTPAEAGIAILPIAGGIALFSLVGYPRLARRFSPNTITVPGLLLAAAGMALMVAAPTDGQYAGDVLPSMLLFAIGGGLAIPAIFAAAMSATAPDAAGTSSGLLSTSNQVGAALGIAALSAVAVAFTTRSGASHAVLPIAGYHAAWAVGAATLALSAAVAAVGLRPARRAQESRSELGTVPAGANVRTCD